MDLIEGSFEHAVGEDRRAIRQKGFGDPIEPTLVHAGRSPVEAVGVRARAVPLMMSDLDATAAMAAAAVELVS